MAFTEDTTITGTWFTDGQIHVKRTTHILENGIRIAERSPHRHVLAPGDDTAQEDAQVRAVASVLWTPAVVQAYRDARARNRVV